MNFDKFVHKYLFVILSLLLAIGLINQVKLASEGSANVPAIAAFAVLLIPCIYLGFIKKQHWQK